MSDDLAHWRAEIDTVDEQLLTLLNRRATLALEIGRIKHGQAMYRPEREAQVLQRVRELNRGPLSGDTVAMLYREVMSACLALEQPISAAYLGPPGTFSEAAAEKHFGQSVSLRPCPSIDEVFRCVESAQADYAVVPVENSTEGAIGRSLDLLVQTSLRICGEVFVRVTQNLLLPPASAAVDLSSIEKVYSHAQSLAQCQLWLDRNLPQARRVALASNSEAARVASADSAAAAIAGEAAARHYGLQVRVRAIEDQPNNTTRFFVLGRHDTARSGRDKTSIVMAAKNRPGAIHDLLTPFAEGGVSLTRLESRPSRTGLWEYLFFVDFEGHQSDDLVRPALDLVDKRAALLKVLGSYPAAAY